MQSLSVTWRMVRLAGVAWIFSPRIGLRAKRPGGLTLTEAVSNAGEAVGRHTAAQAVTKVASPVRSIFDWMPRRTPIP